MAVNFPNGSQIAVASTIAVAKNMTAITNSTLGGAAVATLEASHGILVNDLVVVASGWGNLDGAVRKVTALATNDATFGGLDTSNQTRYPAGSGTGTVRKITAWTAVTQVSDLQTSGGEQQFATYQFLDADSEKKKPTIRSAMDLSFNLGDDPALPWYSVLRAISDSRADTPVRVTLPNGAIIYYNGVITMAETPTMTVNEIMKLNVTVSLAATPTRY